MATAVFGHHPWKVQELVDGVASGRIRLPDIQRPFVWSNAKIRDLIDSMYNGYPVGELMFWANSDGGHSRAIGEGTQDVSMQVVDGQQRLTSLYAVMKGLKVWREDYSQEAVAVAFSPIHERFEVPTPIIKRSPEWIPDIRAVFDSPIEARHAFLKRYREAQPDEPLDEILIETRINQLHQLNSYLFQVVQLGEDVKRPTVADVFVRINSEGVNLDAADFILTWLSVFWEDGRTELETFARHSRFTPLTASQIDGEEVSWTPHNPFLVVDPGHLLRVVVALGLNRGRLQAAYNALRGRNPRTRELDKEAREEALAQLKEAQGHVLRPLHWDEFLRVVERAGFRTNAMVTSTNLMLYTYTLWLVGRVRFGVGIDALRELMARWLFMSLLTGRYTNSPESAIQNDLNRLDGLDESDPDAFVQTLDRLITAAMPDDWWRVSLPEALNTSSKRAPAFVAYQAALVILDADVLLSPMSVREWMNPRQTVKGAEFHHLFPKGYLRKHLDITVPRRLNQVANFALVEWSTNIEISDSPPTEYWPAQCKDKNLTGDRLARQMQVHALADDWTDMSYDDFLVRRRELMAHVTREAFRRLSDPTYVPDLTITTEPLPEPSLDAMTLEDLVLAGHVAAGTVVVGEDADHQFIGEITEDGSLRVGTHTYDTLTRAARELGADVEDGWTFWTVQADDDDEPMPLADIREAAERERAGRTSHPSDEPVDPEVVRAEIQGVISRGESARVEFKSTGRRNLHTGQKDAAMEWAVVKTVAGFMNARGGTLLVGVDDDGQPVGLQEDYPLLRKSDRDGWELWLTDVLSTCLGKVAAGDVDVTFAELDGCDVARIDVAPASQPVFATPLKGDKREQFLVRINNSTQELVGSEALDYQRRHWPN